MTLKKITSVVLICIMMITAVFGSITPQPVYADTPITIKIVHKVNNGRADASGVKPKIYVVNKETNERLEYVWPTGNQGALISTYQVVDEDKWDIEVENYIFEEDFWKPLARINKYYSCEYENEVERKPLTVDNVLEFDITSTLYTSINGQVIFKDDFRPTELEISLLENGVVLDTVKTDASKDWKYDFGRKVVVNNNEELIFNTSTTAPNGYYTRSVGYDIEIVPMTKITLTKELVGTSEETEFGVYILPNFTSRKTLWAAKLARRYPITISYLGYKYANQVIEGAKRWDNISEMEPVLPVIDALLNVEDVKGVIDKMEAGEIKSDADLNQEQLRRGYELMSFYRDWFTLEGENYYDLSYNGHFYSADWSTFDTEANMRANEQSHMSLIWFTFAPIEKGQDWATSEQLGTDLSSSREVLEEILLDTSITSFEDFINKYFKNRFYFYTTLKDNETKITEIPVENLYSLIILENDYEDTVEPEMIKIVNHNGIIVNKLMTEEEIEELRFKDYEATLKNTGKTTKDIKVTKEWIDTDESLRPDCIIVQLLANGETSIGGMGMYFYPQVVRKQENYSTGWKNLPMYDTEGNEIEYTVKELYAGDGYQLKEIKETDEGFTIVNEYKPKTTTITLSKELVGESDKDKFGIYVLPFTDNFNSGLYSKRVSQTGRSVNAHSVISISNFLDTLKEYDKTADVKLYPVYSKLFDQEFITEMKQIVENSDNGRHSIDTEIFTEEQNKKLDHMNAYFYGQYDMSEIHHNITSLDPDYYANNGVDNFKEDYENYMYGMLFHFEDFFNNELTVKSYGYEDFQDYVNKAILNNKVFYYEISVGETKTIEIPNELVHLIIIEEDSEDITEFEPIFYGDADVRRRAPVYGDSQPKTEFEYHLVNKGQFEPKITNTTVRVGESTATEKTEASYMLGLSEDSIELFDTVDFEGLDKDLTYTIKSTLYSNNDVVQSKLTEIKNQDSGSVEVKFDNKISEGTYDIKTEILLDNEVVFTHNDELNTKLERATITKQLPLPTVATSAEAKDENGLIPEKNQTIVDTVNLTNLVVGVEYTLTGELRVKSSNTEVEQYVCNDYTFTAKESNETHKVTFDSIDATSLGGDKLVVFETLTWKSDVHGDIKEAKHDDINDEAQTVAVKRYPTIQIRKTDATTTEELIGAELVVTDLEGSIIDKWTSDGAVHIIENIKPGTYTLTENQAPVGYNVAESITFEVDDNGVVGDPVEMKDAPYVEVSFTKRELGGEELEGATIQIIDSEGNIIDEWVSTTEPHKIKLPDGEYIMHEEVAPEGYYVATDIPFTVDSKNAEATAEVDMSDQRWGEVVISKVDAATSEELPGATLVLKDDEGNIIDEWESKEEPHRIHLEEGTYTLTEITAPDGYNVAETITFVVNREGLVEGEKVEMLDQPYTEVEFSKRNLNGEEIAGAELWIIDTEGNIVDKWTSEIGVSHKIKLPDGDYVMHEEVAPNGYFVATDIPFTVKAGTATNTTKVDMKDAPWPTVEISKIDATTSEELPGATLVVKDANGDTVKQWVSTEETYKLQLEPGEYTLTEITAPSGYEVAETINFTVDENGLVGSEKVVMKDAPKKYEVKINKTALNGKELAGATIKVTGENFEKEWISKENETMDITVLAGVYTLEEVVAPEGFDRVTTKVDFSVSKEGEVKILTTEIENGEIEYKNGVIVLKDRPSGVPLPFDEEVVISVVKKSDDDKKLPLKGAEITLFTEDGKVAKDTEGKDCIALTDENGEVKFKVFKSHYVGEEDEYGRVVIKQSEDIKYYIQETKAPEGYHINSNKFEVVYGEETEILDKVIVTPPAPQETPKSEAPKSDVPKNNAPKTGDTNNMTLYIILGLTSLSGATVLLKKNRNKTKNYN